MKKWIVALILALVVLGGGLALAKVPWDSFSEPPIPHAIEERTDCISCHAQGGVKPYPDWHAKRQLGNNDCLRCHKLAAAGAKKGAQR